MDKTKYRQDIDGLRAIAVGLVVLFHAFPSFAPGGFIGVDVFFVISGYLITGILVASLERETFSLTAFYGRRIKRIFPALLCMLAFVSIAGWVLLFPQDYARLGSHISGGASFVANLQLWRESGYFDADAATKPLLHLWSLGVEEQFYIIWPLMLYLFYRLRISLFPALGALAIASLAWGLHLAHTDTSAAFYSPLSRTWELAAGGLLAVAVNRGSLRVPARFETTLAVVGLALIVIAGWSLNSTMPFPGWLALFPVLGAVLIIASGRDSWVARNMLARREVVYIGLISYPLYLWHWPILSFIHMRESGIPSPFLRVMAVVLSIILAALTYHLVERPIRSSSAPSAKRIISAAGAFMVVFFVGGLLIYFNSGFPSRFSKQIQEIASFKYDPTVPYREHVCFLTAAESAKKLGSCSDGKDQGGRSTVLLWGDSYSAALYPGYKKVLDGKVKLLQVSAVGCPPAVGFSSGGRRCSDIVAEVMKRVRAEDVGRVVMAARWTGQGWPAIAPNVAEAIKQLRELGVRHIDIVGQLPEWPATLPISMLDAYKKDGRIHDRLLSGWVGPRTGLENSLRAFAAAHGARYLSPTSVLCNQDGCLTVIGGDLGKLESFDRGHLTAAASKYLVQRFPQ